jgi:hypothetical protein
MSTDDGRASIRQLLVHVRELAIELESSATRFINAPFDDGGSTESLFGALVDQDEALADAMERLSRTLDTLKGEPKFISEREAQIVGMAPGAIELLGEGVITLDEYVRPARERAAAAILIMSKYFADRVEELLPHAQRGIAVAKGGRKGAAIVNTEERHAETEVRRAVWKSEAAKLRGLYRGESKLQIATRLAQKVKGNPRLRASVETIRKHI